LRTIATTITSQCCELQHHRRYSIVSNNVAIVATLVRLTSIRFSSHVHSTFVRFLSDDLFNFRPSTFVHLRTFVLRPIVLHPMLCAYHPMHCVLGLTILRHVPCCLTPYHLASCHFTPYHPAHVVLRLVVLRFCYFTPCILTSYAYGLASYHFAILPFHSMFVLLLIDLCSAFIRRPFDLISTFVCCQSFSTTH
jgi:hypothetical protein